MTTSVVAHRAWLEGIGTHPANQQFFPVRPYNLHLCPSPGARILDVGAHTGANLLYYASRGFRCVGVEAAKGCCDLFHQQLAKVPQLAPRPVMVHSMFEDYESAAPFQALLCGETLCYSEDPRRMAEHMASCMSLGGVALVAMQTAREKEFPTFLTLDELADLMRAVGFRIDWARTLPGLGNAHISTVRCFKEGV